MERRPYRAVNVKDLDVERVFEEVRDRSIVVAIDVGKEKMFAAVMEHEYEAKVTMKWDHPSETRRFVSLLRQLPVENVQVVMEPSGTYGDSVRYHVMEAGIMVFRVSPKRSHDAREVYDGVPSLHDGKSCAVIGKLHMDGMSEPWPFREDEQRVLGAAIGLMDLYDDQFHRNANRLEAQLARHWPELCEYLALGSPTMLELLGAFGGPGEVWARRGEARELMRRVGGRFLKAEKITAVLESARCTVGVPQIAEEREALAELALETLRGQGRGRKAKVRVEKLSEGNKATAGMGKVVGKATAAVLCYSAGKSQDYGSAGSYVKALGLNLKEKSSGKYKGQLKITKRGPSVARRYLYMAVLRLIEKDGVFSAWYRRKVERDGGKKGRAIVALMRKLAKGLWHVGRGKRFDSMVLFDTRRLGFSER